MDECKPLHGGGGRALPVRRRAGHHTSLATSLAVQLKRRGFNMRADDVAVNIGVSLVYLLPLN